MSGIGVDISEVIEELGVSATILRTPTNLTEKIMYEINEQATKIFAREFQLSCEFKWDTVIVSGDLIQFGGNTYMVINKTLDSFEDSPVEYAGVLLKCNLPATAMFMVWASTTNQTTFVVTQGWTITKDPAYGLIFKEERNAPIDSDENTGRNPSFTLQCFVPESYNIAPETRLYLTADEYYRVQDVEKYDRPGVHVLTLVEDERLVYTPPVTP